jgi:outer membrane protein TolC
MRRSIRGEHTVLSRSFFDRAFHLFFFAAIFYLLLFGKVQGEETNSIPTRASSLSVPQRTTENSQPVLSIPSGSPMQPTDEISFSDAPKGLTLLQIEDLAKQHNPTLLQARALITGIQGKAVEAGLYPNPETGLMWEQIGVKDTAGEFIGGFVRQEVVTAGKLRLSRKKYCQRMKIAQWEAVAQQYRILNDVRIHYYRALAAEASLKIQKELLKNAQDFLLTTREKFNVGQANQVDLHEAKVALEQQMLDVEMAEIDDQMAWESLSSVVGRNLSRTALLDPLEGELEPISWEEALAGLYRDNPELGKAWAKYRADQITLQRERAEPVPNVVFTGAVGYNDDAKETVAAAEMGMSIPIFDRNQGTIRQAQADLQRQQAEIRRTELTLKRKLADYYRRYLTAIKHVRQYREIILPEAAEAYETQLKSYEVDRVNWNEVLDSEKRFYTLRNAQVHNLVHWREAEIALRGYLMVDGLAAPSGVTPPGHIDSVPKPR